MRKKTHLIGLRSVKKGNQRVALFIQAKDDGNDLMRIFRESPGLANVSIDPAQCDIIFRMEIGNKVVLNIRLFEDGKSLSVMNTLRKALENAKLSHLDLDEDPWHSCPKSGHCVDKEAVARGKCNCGVEAHNNKIDVALKG